MRTSHAEPCGSLRDAASTSASANENPPSRSRCSPGFARAPTCLPSSSRTLLDLAAAGLEAAGGRWDLKVWNSAEGCARAGGADGGKACAAAASLARQSVARPSSRTTLTDSRTLPDFSRTLSDSSRTLPDSSRTLPDSGGEVKEAADAADDSSPLSLRASSRTFPLLFKSLLSNSGVHVSSSGLLRSSGVLGFWPSSSS
mmetsp:Transcript_24764/g.62673  ORF Transcript_24764/g.62673 Transcript_24764/m.62673 type:complete len:200 (+) Transcript_24764:466-1065(+)